MYVCIYVYLSTYIWIYSDVYMDVKADSGVFASHAADTPPCPAETSQFTVPRQLSERSQLPPILGEKYATRTMHN